VSITCAEEARHPVDPLVVAAANYGTLPDWLAGVGTVGTLAFSLWLFARQQADRRLAQAQMVSAWPTAPEPTPTGGGVIFAVKVKNASTEPVYDVRATMVPYDSPHADNPEAATGQVGTTTVRMPILPGGEELESGVDPIRTGILPGAVGLSFTDAQGIRWQRLPSGVLREHPERLASRSRVGLAVRWRGPGR
jgi:hypothetical protein